MDYMGCYNKPHIEDYLMHHGIKGQQWGVKNGPPYPLGVSDHSASEKKAGWQKSLDKHGDTEDNKHKAKIVKEDSATKKSGLTDSQKKAIKIGAAVVATALVAYGTYKLADSGEFHRLAEKGKELIQGPAYEGFKRNEAFSRPMNVDEITHTFFGKINPGYGATVGTSNNCRRCTFAYELSRRGFDVKATRTLQGTGQTGNGLNRAINEDVVGFKTILREFRSALHDDNYDTVEMLERLKHQKQINLRDFEGKAHPGKKILAALSQMPNGARGELELGRQQGSGHSLAWEIIDGKPVVFDFQTSKVYKRPGVLTGLMRSQQFVSAGMIRLDDVDLDLDFLRRWVEND